MASHTIDARSNSTPPDPLLATRARERGSVLIMALAFALIVGTLLVGTLTTTILQAKTMRHELEMTLAQGLTEGAAEIALKQMVDEVSNFQTPSTSGVAMVGGRAVGWTAIALGSPIERFADDGVRMIAQPYQITSRWDEGMATSRISRIVDLTVTPIFQYAIFYNSVCQISPGPAMSVEGRVHVNGDLYLDTPTSMIFDTDYLNTTGDIIRGRLNKSTRGGDVMIRQYQGTNYVELTDTDDSTSSGWVQGALANWGGGVRSGAHGVEAVGVPEMPAIEAGGYYESNAGLRVIGTQAFDANGLLLALPPGTIAEKTMYDARERVNVKVTEIDIGRLASSGFYPLNGLIYARRTDATTSTPNGIRLTNGATLPTGLTVVTENPLYVHGDYNTINKQPASVIADAVNLLSNSWDDSRTSGSGVPTGSSTTYNMSVIGGQVMYAGRGSGGFQNIVRLHENWRNQTLNILGAFSVLFESQYAVTPWRMSGVFSPPNRVWAFDSDLLDPTNLPPYTPSGVSMRRVLWDDNRPVHFKIADSKLSLFPSAPVYDPWTYDPGYMGKVIDDPNEILDRKRDVDYSDKFEAEAPDTADRNVKTEAEKNEDDRKVAYAAAIQTALQSASSAEGAHASALEAIQRGDLVGAGARAAQAEIAARTAADAYNNSNFDPGAQEAARRARKAADEAASAVHAAVNAAMPEKP